MLEKIVTDKEKAYHWIQDKIITNKYSPGSILDKNEISNTLGASITPVREALILLSHENFVSIVPNKKTIVSLIDIDYIKEVTFIRSCLECGIVEHLSNTSISSTDKTELNDILQLQKEALHDQDIVKNYELDFLFHKSLCQLTGFCSLWDDLEKYSKHLIRVINCSTINLKLKKKALQDHIDIVDAIVNNKPTIAKNRMKKHVYRIMEDLNNIPPHYVKR